MNEGEDTRDTRDTRDTGDTGDTGDTDTPRFRSRSASPAYAYTRHRKSPQETEEGEFRRSVASDADHSLDFADEIQDLTSMDFKVCVVVCICVYMYIHIYI
jgi:hypothetical protein